MSHVQTIEERLTTLEHDMSQLMRQFRDARNGETWLDRVAGSFRDDDEFEEILRIGSEIRRVGT